MTKWGVFAVTCLPWACSNSAPAEDQPCPSGGTRCGGECVDTTTDIGNCGQCGRVCPTGVGCFASACTSPGSLNQPRQGHALVKGHDGRIYCIGGAYGATALQEIGDVEVYDPRTNHWRRVESLVTPRAMLGAAARDGQIIAFGSRSTVPTAPRVSRGRVRGAPRGGPAVRARWRRVPALACRVGLQSRA